jgi:hypothetical protein
MYGERFGTNLGENGGSLTVPAQTLKLTIHGVRNTTTDEGFDATLDTTGPLMLTEPRMSMD